MDSKFSINSIVLYALLAMSVIVTILFFAGGSETVVYNGESFDEPNHTSTLMYFAYFLLGAAALATIVSATISFTINAQKDIKNAIKTASVFGSLALLLVITYAIGDGTPMNIIGYEGTDNVEGSLKMTDMFLYSTYVLLFIGAVAAITSPFVKKLK